jgi:ATP-dependent exoDNAse (exonuclease V) beta subunit
VGDEGETLRLEPLRLDPDGAFLQRTDPVGKLVSAIRKQRRLEEDVRLAYVAITRAAESAVFGLPEKGSHGVQERLRLAWAQPMPPPEDQPDAKPTLPDIPGVCYLPVEPLFDLPLPSPKLVSITPDAALSPAWAQGTAWVRQAPSSVETALSSVGLSASEIGRRAASLAVAGGGYHPPGYKQIESPGDGPASDEKDWGTLVHAWFARWGFRGQPDLEGARASLLEDHGVELPHLAAWLLEVAQAVEAHKSSPLWQLVTKPGVQLHFELPLVGVASLGAPHGDPFLLSGRTDLLVRDPSAPPAQRWTVIDFKAGKHAPSLEDPGQADPQALAKHLFAEATLRRYAPQLEAYREALDRAFAASGLFGQGDQAERVGHVALWFVRRGASVGW